MSLPFSLYFRQRPVRHDRKRQWAAVRLHERHLRCRCCRHPLYGPQNRRHSTTVHGWNECSYRYCISGTESEAAADFRSGSGRPKKATADCHFRGGFFGLTTAGMKIDGGFQQNWGDELKTLPQAYRIPLWYELHHGNIFRNHRSGISMWISPYWMWISIHTERRQYVQRTLKDTFRPSDLPLLVPPQIPHLRLRLWVALCRPALPLHWLDLDENKFHLINTFQTHLHCKLEIIDSQDSNDDFMINARIKFIASSNQNSCKSLLLHNFLVTTTWKHFECRRIGFQSIFHPLTTIANMFQI